MGCCRNLTLVYIDQPSKLVLLHSTSLFCLKSQKLSMTLSEDLVCYYNNKFVRLPEVLVQMEMTWGDVPSIKPGGIPLSLDGSMLFAQLENSIT